MDAAGNAFSFNQNADQAAASMNCAISVPANALTAQGLATPWQLGDGCSWANGATEGAFVEATILAPNGKVQVYDPLVVNQGTQSAVAPTPPTIAAGSQVIISLGFNGNALALVGPGAAQANCIDALGNSLINQTPQCNAANFYRLANAEIARGTLKAPALGTAKDGQACPTTRDFSVIDQDQSDNVVARYLFDPNTGQTAQATAANVGNMAQAVTQTNGSDEGLIAGFVDPALGCRPWMARNPTNPNGIERLAGAERADGQAGSAGYGRAAPGQRPAAPGRRPVQRGQDQPLPAGDRPGAAVVQDDRPAERGEVLPEHGQHPAPRLKLDATLEAGTASPVPALGNNLANFLAARLSGSFDNLNCNNFGLTNPVTLTLDGEPRGDRRDVNSAAQRPRSRASGRRPARPAAGRKPAG